MDESTPRELKLIMDYLSSECYTGTLDALGYGKTPILSMREKIKELCMSGKVEEMYKLLTTEHPGILDKYPHVVSLIFSQIFIEFIRNNQPEKALSFGRTSMHAGQDITKTQELFLLLAYKNPEECEKMKEFMSFERRERVFSAVDGIIKEKTAGRKASLLEYISKAIKYSSCMQKEE
ncbi:glucose-induced degradation protein 8 [Nematocida major]|uniref:glucose-induced degradation protein 8 n=1 Tax=Nematocida major TaxID=1912982 RepID=UPI002008D858|nr:glucose-induced degradation protein 8 [Nematocida major]KAH9386884.1 glucose-induced degradation protein 8 [Nematocida major]